MVSIESGGAGVRVPLRVECSSHAIRIHTVLVRQRLAQSSAPVQASCTLLHWFSCSHKSPTLRRAGSRACNLTSCKMSVPLPLCTGKKPSPHLQNVGSVGAGSEGMPGEPHAYTCIFSHPAIVCACTRTLLVSSQMSHTNINQMLDEPCASYQQHERDELVFCHVASSERQRSSLHGLIL